MKLYDGDVEIFNFLRSYFFKDVTDIKIPAILHIDDRALCFNGNYNKTLEEINNFKPYWKS